MARLPHTIWYNNPEKTQTKQMQQIITDLIRGYLVKIQCYLLALFIIEIGNNAKKNSSDKEFSGFNGSNFLFIFTSITESWITKNT